MDDTSTTPPLGPRWLADRHRSGAVLIIDGATGTELEARGVPMVEKGWSVMAQLEHPDVLRELHSDYLRAGASVLITNTFAAGRHLLEPGGLGERVADAHRRAVTIAQQARDAVGIEAAIAGSISTYMADETDVYWRSRLDATYAEQAELLAGAGVDLIVCEMMQDPELAGPAIDAALATGLPVWVGFSASRGARGSLGTKDDVDRPFAGSVRALIDDRIAAAFVMHTELPDVMDALDAVEQHWSGALGVYPESGYFEEPHWRFVDIVEPSVLVTAAEQWADRGVRIIGGCCGLGVDHIRALSDRFAGPAPRG